MTLRARLILAATLLLCVLALIGVVVVANQNRELVRQIDEQLYAARDAVSRLPVIPAGPPSAVDSIPAPGQPVGQQGALSSLWIGELTPDGTVERRISPGLGPAVDPSIDPDDVADAVATGRPFTADGSPSYRVVAQSTDDRGVLLIGLSLERVDQATDQLMLALVVAALVVAAVMALLAWWIWRLGLRPIRRMTNAANAIRLGDRTRRVEPYSARTEAGALSVAMNTMLDERQDAEDELRRFVADASHELRSPLTSIHGYVQLYQRGGLREPRALDDAMGRIERESSRMMGLVDDLLLLARLDQARPLQDEPVDLGAVLRDAASDAAAVAPTRAVTLEVAEPLVVRGDDQRLHQVIAAVVANALVHTPDGTAITIRGTAAGTAGAIVEVADEGPGMSPEVTEHAFERFYRGDPARSRDRGGSGLGLSIVESVIARHGGRVELESAPGAGTMVRIVLPSQSWSVDASGDSQETRTRLFGSSQA